MKKLALAVIVLVAVSGGLPAQNFDIEGVRSDEQFRGAVQAYHRGYFSDSVVSIEKALSIKPSNTLAMEWLARILWKSGYEQEALTTFERLARVSGADGLVRDWIEVLRLRNGTARDIPRSPTFVIASELDGTLKTGHPFKRPTSVRPRGDGSFYVTAFGSGEVLLYDVNFRLLRVLRGGLEGFDRPYDVLELDNGTLLVTEYGGNRVAICNERGDKIRTFGVAGRGEGAFLGPQYMAEDGQGFIYVTDWGNSRIAKYDRDGTFILSFGGVSGPSGIAVREERVYVSDVGNRRISIFDTSGNFLQAIGEGTLRAPEGLCFTPDGKLLLSDSNRILEADVEREVWKIKADASSHARRLVDQAPTPNGEILGVDFDGSRVVLLSDTVALYSGYVVRVDRVNATQFPRVFADVSVEDRFGRPVVGLGINNFILTESRRSVGSTTIVSANAEVRAVDISLLVEGSPAVAAVRPEAERAVAELYALATREGRIKAIWAGERAVKETEFGEARLRFSAAALQGAPSARWRLDAGARLAAQELVTTTGGAKRAVVFLTSGDPGARAFTTYSLTEIASFMRANAVAFYPVIIGGGALSEDLAFLAAETGGKSYSAAAPGGLAPVLQEIRSRVTPLYTISYSSPSPPEFGTRYIPLEVEVTMQKISGRDESGYFAPYSAGQEGSGSKTPAPSSH